MKANGGISGMDFQTYRKRFKVKEVEPSVLKDYAGMNFFAARALGFREVPVHKNDILVDSRFHNKMKKATIVHEEYEAYLMNKGHSYWYSHQRALQMEHRRI